MPSSVNTTEVDSVLTGLGNGGAVRVARSIVTAGLGTIKRFQKRAAPRGLTKQTAESIGKRLTGGKGGFVGGKSGIGVAQRRTNDSQTVPHAHLVATGSRPRFRKRIGGRFAYLRAPGKSQLSTGAMPANPFIATATAQAQAPMTTSMNRAAARALDRETAKAQRRATRAN